MGEFGGRKNSAGCWDPVERRKVFRPGDGLNFWQVLREFVGGVAGEFSRASGRWKEASD